MVVFGRAAERTGPIASLFAGGAAFLLAVGVLQLVDLPAWLSLLFVGACFALGLAALPGPASPPALATTPPWWDLPSRALASLVLVVAISAASGALGPDLSGLLAPFPIITSVLAVFTYAHDGRTQLRVLLRNFLVGFYGFAAFCFVLTSTLESLSGLAAFLVALAAALAVQACVLVLRLATPRLSPNS